MSEKTDSLSLAFQEVLHRTHEGQLQLNSRDNPIPASDKWQIQQHLEQWWENFFSTGGPQ